MFEVMDEEFDHAAGGAAGLVSRSNEDTRVERDDRS